MKIRVTDITEKEKLLESGEQASAYPVLLQVQEAGDCVFLKPIDVVAAIVKEYGHIRVKGKVETSVELSCSRCLSVFPLEVVSNFTIYYTKSSDGYGEDEVELSEEDLLSATYEGDEIDLTHEIAEQVMLEIPYKPLCKEDCLGLCPTCGVDRNTSRCNCMDSQSNLAFSSLGGFKVKK